MGDGAAAASGIVVRLFGGVSAHGPGDSTSFAGSKQRALVARLALEAGRAVAFDHLVDGVWGDDVPASIRATVQVHVSQIRRSFASIGLDDLVVTRAPGYVLDLPAAAVDALRFEHDAELVLAGADDRTDAQRLVDAQRTLALWSGDPLVAVGDPPFAAPAVARLESCRVRLLCTAVHAAIQVGRGDELLTSVDSAALAYPFSEPLWTASAELLYALDRQVDALDRLSTLRRTLVDELGLDVGPATADLERRILNHDPSLRPVRPVRSTPTVLRPPLPVPRSIVGRESVLAAIAADLEVAPLVTLTGPAGVGKTTVAVHAAQLAAPHRRDGACFVDLAALDGHARVWPSVAASIGFRPTSASTGREELCEVLAGLDVVLVLDNCEHVLDSVADFIGGLDHTPGLRVIATSRTPLGLPHERVRPVPLLGRHDLVAVFTARASTADVTFDPSDDLAVIEQLADEFDGLALGAELVASMVRSMTTAEILAAVRTEALPPNRQRGVVARHRSMDDAIGWSVDLLDDTARRVLARCSVFAAGTDAAGVRAVVADAELTDSELATTLSTLVESSLLVAERTPFGTWYRMLAPIRAYASRLLATAELERAREAHAQHVVSTIVDLTATIESPDPRVAVLALGRLAPDIRVAHRHLLRSGPGAVCRLLAAFSPISMSSTSALPEALEWLRDTVDGLEQQPDDVRLRITLNAAWMLGLEHDEYLDLVERAMALAQRLGDRRATLVAHALRADALGDISSVDAVAEGRRALALAGEGASLMLGVALNHVVNPMLRALLVDDARELLDRACAGDTTEFGVFEPIVYYQAGRLRLMANDVEGAARLQDRAERSAYRVGSSLGLSYALFGRSEVARAQGRVDDALAFLWQAVELDRIIDPSGTWGEYGRIAMIACDLGDEDTLALCAVELERATRPHERIARDFSRGCLALVRGFDDISRGHFADALTLCAQVNHAPWFADITDYWARTVSDERGATARATAQRVRDRSLAPADAVAAVAGDHGSIR